MMTAALLRQTCRVTLFEANDYIGGHTHTVSVSGPNENLAIDTGFIVFNERTYPNFCRMLRQLDVASQPTEMSFSVRCDRTNLEYNGSSLNGLFADRRNLMRPGFYRMLRDILRFNREAEQRLNDVSAEVTVGEFLREEQYSEQFSRYYLLPMGAAIWSCPIATFEQFPIRFIVEFYRNHGLLQVRDRPVWRTISGGSREYVAALTAPYREQIRLDCPVQSVRRDSGRVEVCSSAGTESFDEVVFACHSDQALKLLDDADDTEREMLSAFPYSKNRVVLHSDTSVLPSHRRAWASWNYHLPATVADRPTLTYCMNILQGIDSPHTYCVTLNEEDSVDPSKVLGRFNYSHPIFTVERAAVQGRHKEVIRRRRTSFCGAYWGNGFHEDGVDSALAVCRAFGFDDWTVTDSNRLPPRISSSSTATREATHVA